MACSEQLRHVTGWIHGFSILVVTIVASIDLYNLVNNNLISIWFPLSIAFMMLLRIPNQICVATNVSNGWYSLITSILDFFIWIVIAFVIHKKWQSIRKQQKIDDIGTMPPAIEYETQ